MDENNRKTLIGWIISVICFVLAVAAVYFVYKLNPQDKPLERLTIVLGYVTAILVFFFGLIVLIAMATNKIDISGLLCEPNENKASLSRFQLLVFIFVIAFSLVMVIVANDPLKFPVIPSGVLLLLGISASTYTVGKGISKSAGGPNGPNGSDQNGSDQDDQQPATNQTTVNITDPNTGKVTTRVHDHDTGQSTTIVHDPTTGETTTTVHNPTMVTTTTTVSPAPPPIVSAPAQPAPVQPAPAQPAPDQPAPAQPAPGENGHQD
ncbi:MAG TPA: hypothetical protein VGM86_35635 [Thermoanaerobaculia bacterium]